MKEVFKQASPILKQLQEAGYEAYFVGGAVRDFILERTISDVDIATSAFPEEVKQVFPVTYDTGIAHGTVTVRYQHELYEVTTFRTEGKYEDFRRPSEVTFIRSLKEDLLRRDFTMNAIAMDEKFHFEDPFAGIKAIQEREIKAVGIPNQRFQEDALRMMRAVRFMSQLDFTIEEKTKAALKREIKLLEHTSVERKTIEWEKMIRGKARKQAMDLLVDVHLHHYLPGLKQAKSGLQNLADWHFAETASADLIWLALVTAIEVNDIQTFLKAWKLPNKLITHVKQAVYWYQLNEPWTDYTLYLAGKEIYSLVEELRFLVTGNSAQLECDKMYERLPIKSISDLAINGKDLLKWYDKKPGPWLKEKLISVEQAVLNKKLPNNREAIRRWLVSGK
ncbi:CCA tRNA nucleotidyltransferase [Listeria sp. PSOL-1]|uniref:CCA tRNA nucleotidyltransferase n=1 Tax=Listeria sp. PSOL-1 TaxID=1844999 RepID=UPI0013D519C1|nr:CCA tRNA nucleotidyltransferase [Listeria sp. PSOL-1]